MFSAQSYFTAYLVITSILVLLGIFKYSQYPNGCLTRTNKPDILSCVVILVFFILFFGYRPYEDDPTHAMMDTVVYAGDYELVKEGVVLPEDFRVTEDKKGNETVKDPLFYLIQSRMAYLGIPIEYWLITVAAIYLIPKIILIRRWFGYNSFIACLFIITAFGFYSGGTNGIRNADASSIFILGLSFIATYRFNWRSLIFGIILCFIAYQFHNSIIISSVAVFASYFIIRNTKSAVAVWITAIILSLIFGNAIAMWGSQFFEDDRAMKYLEAGMDENYVASRFSEVGFRWDFLLYSAMPILMGWYVTIKKGIKDKVYQIILNTYILANSVWIIFIYAAYNNRFAAVSWALYSYVLLYPLVRYNLWGEKQSYYTAWILIGQLVFTYIF